MSSGREFDRLQSNDRATHGGLDGPASRTDTDSCARRYARSTEAVDLAVGVDPHRLDDLAALLFHNGFVVEVSQPDASDPLGGVVQVNDRRHRPGR